jgi:hypothetical protein
MARRAIIVGVRGPDRPMRLRLAGSAGLTGLAGFAGSALLAAGAYGAGALPHSDPGAGLRGSGAPGTGFWLGLAACAAGLVLLSGSWWRLGRTRVTPPWLLATAGLWAVPLLLAPPLASRDVYAYACQGALWNAGADPYSAGAADGGCPWVDAVPAIWQHSPTPYGPLAVSLSAAAAATGNLLVAIGVLRLIAVAGVVLVAVYGDRLARACGTDPAAARWLAVLSPLVLLHAVSGAHNDALVAGLIVTALAVATAARTPYVLGAGVLLGLAVAVKVTALVAVPFVVLLAVRDGGPKAIARAAAGVVGAAAIAFGTLSLGTGLGTGWVGALRDTGSLVQWTSPPTGLGMAVGYLLRAAGAPGAYDEAVAVARIVGLVAFAAIGVALVWRAYARVRAGAPDATRTVVAACGAALAAAALLFPVFYPWYAIAPLAVLASATTDPRVRAWLAGAAVALSFLILPDGLGLAVLTKVPGALLDAVAVAATLVFVLRRRRGSAVRPGGRATPTPRA